MTDCSSSSNSTIVIPHVVHVDVARTLMNEGGGAYVRNYALVCWRWFKVVSEARSYDYTATISSDNDIVELSRKIASRHHLLKYFRGLNIFVRQRGETITTIANALRCANVDPALLQVAIHGFYSRLERVSVMTKGAHYDLYPFFKEMNDSARMITPQARSTYRPSEFDGLSKINFNVIEACFPNNYMYTFWQSIIVFSRFLTQLTISDTHFSTMDIADYASLSRFIQSTSSTLRMLSLQLDRHSTKLFKEVFDGSTIYYSLAELEVGAPSSFPWEALRVAAPKLHSLTVNGKVDNVDEYLAFLKSNHSIKYTNIDLTTETIGDLAKITGIPSIKLVQLTTNIPFGFDSFDISPTLQRLCISQLSTQRSITRIINGICLHDHLQHIQLTWPSNEPLEPLVNMIKMTVSLRSLSLTAGHAWSMNAYILSDLYDALRDNTTLVSFIFNFQHGDSQLKNLLPLYLLNNDVIEYLSLSHVSLSTRYTHEAISERFNIDPGAIRTVFTTKRPITTYQQYDDAVLYKLDHPCINM
ncbi:hypothetical protein SAMD00019534_039230, partial [Acytostelium subglobosum LB1]|uniref:hypothetical protein n=1 Tax=Acytostelium subglobosum LB1 TaxID=1410327 RepID=UPI0006449752